MLVTVPLSSDLTAEVVRFLTDYYGSAWQSQALARACYAWKYLDRPAHTHGLPSGTVLLDQEKVVGFCGQMPRWLERGVGRPVEAGWISDFNIAPALQGQGAGRKLLQAVLASRPATTCLVASTQAERLYEKLGMKRDDSARLYVFKRRAERYHAARQPRGARRVAGWIRGLLDRSPLPPRPVAPQGFETVPWEPAIFGGQDPWNTLVANAGQLRGARRTWDVLAWFERFPIPGSQTIALVHRGRPCGHIVVRADLDARNLWRGRIIDVVAPLDAPHVWSWATAEAIHLLTRDHDVYYVEAIASHPVQVQALQGTGFQERATYGVWCSGEVAVQGGPWLTSFLDKDNAHRGALLGPP